MTTFHRRTLMLVLPAVLVACDSGTPTQPTAVTQPAAAAQPAPQPAPTPLPGHTFIITGVVTGDGGAPMAGAVVTMAHWEGGHVNFPAVSTDANGGYAITFSADPLGNGFVARAQVVAAGYEEYWRSLLAVPSGAAVVQDFRLHRITRITAGDSISLSVPPDIGDCRGWVAEVCAIVRVTASRDGNLRIEVVPANGSTATPPVEVCCVRGDEQAGNPMTVPVTAEYGLELRIGMPRGVTTTQSFLVKTSYEGS